MATKTSVTGNRVTIDDGSYEIKPAGTDRYSVFDEFGGKLGVFTLRGKAVETEDYGVAGAPPVVQVAKLWRDGNQAKPGVGAAPESKMVCRITTHERPAAADLARARAHRAWLKKQPGAKAAYLVSDPASGKTLTISVWETRDHLDALKTATPPEGAAPLRAASTEILPFVEDP